MPGILATVERSCSPSWVAMLSQVALGGASVQEWQDVDAGVRIAVAGEGASDLTSESSLFVSEDAVAALDGRLLPLIHSVSDAARVVDAYRRHGTECARHLLGEFAFVLWDRTQRRILAGCDPIGLRSLAYCPVEGALLLCSRALALLHHPRVPRRLNRVYLAHAICDLWAQPAGTTPFAAIQRIQPGFALTAQGGHVVERRVDRITAAPPGGSRWSAEHSFARFWECLEGCVRDAISDEPRTAIELSSGLDSTAVALCAEKVGGARGTLSIVASASGADERKLIEAFVSGRPHLPWHAIDCSADRALGESWETLPVPDDPCVLAAAFRPAKLRMAGAARDLGYRLLLDGEGGDEAFGLAPRLGDLVAHGSFRALARYMAGRGWRSALVRELLVPRLPAVLRRSWAAREYRRVDPIPPWMSAAFRTSDVASEALEHRAAWSRHGRARDALPALLAVSPTVGSRMAARLFLSALGIRSRSPILDRRLLELVLALRPDLLADPRRSKIFLRRALGGRAPEAIVQQPKNNGLYAWFQAQGLRNVDVQACALSIRENPVLAGWVRTDVLACVVEETAGGAPSAAATMEQVCALISVDKWLNLANSSIGGSLRA